MLKKLHVVHRNCHVLKLKNGGYKNKIQMFCMEHKYTECAQYG